MAGSFFAGTFRTATTHLVRYFGWYSNRARGERAKQLATQAEAKPFVPIAEPSTEFAARARAAWARLIRKVYEADPLECPQCNGPMRVIALIEDPGVIRRILQHLGLWAAQPPRAKSSCWPAALAGALRHSTDLPSCTRHRAAWREA